MIKTWLPKYPIPLEYCWILYQLNLRYIRLEDIAHYAGCSPEAAWNVLIWGMPSQKINPVLAKLLGYPSWDSLWADAYDNSKKDYDKITQITSQTCNIREEVAKEKEILEKLDRSSLLDLYATESPDQPCSQEGQPEDSFHWKYDPSTFFSIPEEAQIVSRMRQQGRLAGRWLEVQRKMQAKEKHQAPLKGHPANMVQAVEVPATKHSDRLPWLHQLRDCKKHPILAKLFGFHLSFKNPTPWTNTRKIKALKKEAR